MMNDVYEISMSLGNSQGSFFLLALISTQDTLEGLVKAEPMSDSLKTQLNDLCRFSRDLGSQSERVSSLIKEYNRQVTPNTF